MNTGEVVMTFTQQITVGHSLEFSILRRFYVQSPHFKEFFDPQVVVIYGSLLLDSDKSNVPNILGCSILCLIGMRRSDLLPIELG